MIWTIIEAGLAIVASSLATIRPLLRAMRVRGFEATENNSNSKRSFQHGSASHRPVAMPPGAYGLSDLPASNEHLTECLSSKTSVPGAPSAVVVTQAAVDPDRIAPAPRTGDKRDAYAIQGKRTGPRPGARAGSADAATASTWSGRSNESMEIHDLEAQSQENPRFGIGSDSER